VAPFPLRIREAEQLLEGSSPDDGRFEEVREKVQEEVRPISDVRGTESYRRDVAGTLTVRALNMLTGN
jgi:CO/xanthine dehydrogenase FAD-binding subunit